MRTLLTTFVLAGGLSAQPSPFPSLARFLGLSPEPERRILANNDEFNRLVRERMRRMEQVQVEIAEETEREPLDPPALGVRYAEIETHCRALRADASKTEQRNRAVLNEAQQKKLGTLEEVFRLLPAAQEAQFTGFIVPKGSTPTFLSSSTTSAIGAVIGGYYSAPGCSVVRPVQRWFDTGDFQGASLQRHPDGH